MRVASFWTDGLQDTSMTSTTAFHVAAATAEVATATTKGAWCRRTTPGVPLACRRWRTPPTHWPWLGPQPKNL